MLVLELLIVLVLTLLRLVLLLFVLLAPLLLIYLTGLLRPCRNFFYTPVILRDLCFVIIVPINCFKQAKIRYRNGLKLII